MIQSSTRLKVSFFHRLDIKLMVVLTSVLLVVFGAVFYLVSQQQQKQVMEQAKSESKAVAQTLLASLQSLMLAGDGNLAADWLQRVNLESSIEHVDVFRIDGVQAFRDLKTIKKVNHYLDNEVFSRENPLLATSIENLFKNDFNQAASGRPAVIQQDNQHLTYLMPIAKDNRCLACHGYDASPVRGVLKVSISTKAAMNRVKQMQDKLLFWLVLSVLALGLAVFVYVRKRMISPLLGMVKLSEKIANHEFNEQLHVTGHDEIAVLARSFNAMSQHLQQTTVSKDYVDNILESLGEMLLVTDKEGKILTANRAASQLLDYNTNELIGLPISSLVSANLEELTFKEQAIIQADDGVESVEVNFKNKSGMDVPVYLTISRLHERNSNAFKMVRAARDMTKQKKAEKALRLAAKVMDTVSNAIMLVDPDIKICLVNPAFTRITGYELEDVVGKNPNILKSGYQDKVFYQTMWQEILERGFWQGEIWNKKKDGSIYPEWLIVTTIKDENDHISHYVSSFLDITERKEFEQKLEHLANHDILTGLPNRLLFMDRLEHALSVCQRSKRKVALIFIDIDGFKLVNDTHGHDVGDALLIQIAYRLKKSIRNSDTVARVGGDEFVMIIEDIVDIDIVIKIANKALKKMRKPFELDDLICNVGASLGISIFPDDSQDGDELSKLADTAMYYSKTSGRNRITVFHDLTKHD